MKTSIIVTTQVRGFHSWKSAPAEVDFLRSRHRHLFHIKVFFEVFHDDRDIEFFIAQTALLKFLDFQFEKFEHGFEFRSCEETAKKILEEFTVQGRNPYRVEVAEDGENGAIVEL